jgi:NO-binding membrane sensor protein with MHYT domain
MLSIGLAILGCFAGLIMTAGIQRAKASEAVLRIVFGGLCVGGGVWSIYCVGLLALILPTEASYKTGELTLSAIAAVGLTIAALAAVYRRTFGKYTLPLSSIIFGAGIVIAHYYAVNAVAGDFTVQYSNLGVAMLAAIAIQTSAIALWFAFRSRGVFDSFLGAIALGLAIASIHYSGMEAVRFQSAKDFNQTSAYASSNYYPAISVAIAFYCVCALCIVAFAVLSFRRHTAHRKTRNAAA